MALTELSPMQTKLQVELPNAVRTTLPSIVSVFIGLWKDTTLLFIINILDFFKLAKDLPNTSPGYLGDFLEPLYVTALVFWIFAFDRVRIGWNQGSPRYRVGQGAGSTETQDEKGERPSLLSRSSDKRCVG